MKRGVRKVARYVGYDIRRYVPHEDAAARFVRIMARRATDLVIDIGANAGQFAALIRSTGYRGRIISIEPLSQAHALLSAAAAHDRLWTAAPRCAVGSHVGEMEINVSANSKSSSILPMLPLHLSSAPESVYVGRERVAVKTLDQIVDEEKIEEPFAVKIDTQGYEKEVLDGLRRKRHLASVIMLEMSLAPLYEREAGFLALYQTLTDGGYCCVSLEPGFIDTETYEVLQVDGIFCSH